MSSDLLTKSDLERSAIAESNQASTGAAIESTISDLAERLDALIKSHSDGDQPDNVQPADAQPADAQPATAQPADGVTRTQPAVEGSRRSSPDAKPGRAPISPATAEELPAVDPPQSVSPTPAPTPAPTAARRSSLPEELKTAKIMIVDDEEVNVLTVRHHLKQGGFEQFITTTNASEAVELLRREQPGVLLLDIHMPEVSGLDILRIMSLDKDLQTIPVVVLTASSDPSTKSRALYMGAFDFLTKPVDPHDLTPRVRNALVVKAHYDQMANQAAKMEELVNRRTAELFQSRQQLILSLARAAEHRDNETGNHVIRVGRYASIVARELGCSKEQSEMIQQAAQLHDVGKIGVPDAILFKPGKLDPQEFEIIKRHCAVGHDIIEPLSERDFQLLRMHARIGENILHVRSSPMLMMASRIAQTHHECWDGTGYPLGLAGEDIPLEGRITSIADVFDALSSKRPYKDPFPREKCFAILQEARGTKFDPQVVDAFFARSAEIIEVQLELMDRVSIGSSVSLRSLQAAHSAEQG